MSRQKPMGTPVGFFQPNPGPFAAPHRPPGPYSAGPPSFPYGVSTTAPPGSSGMAPPMSYTGMTPPMNSPGMTAPSSNLGGLQGIFQGLLGSGGKLNLSSLSNLDLPSIISNAQKVIGAINQAGTVMKNLSPLLQTIQGLNLSEDEGDDDLFSDSDNSSAESHSVKNKKIRKRKKRKKQSKQTGKRSATKTFKSRQRRRKR